MSIGQYKMINVKVRIQRFLKRVLIYISPAVALIAGLQIYLSVSVSDDDIRNNVHKFFVENFHKAVKFDHVSVRFTGKIILSNFNMSKGLDFNDNLNLLSCEEISMDLSLWKLIRRSILLKGIYMDGADIAFGKQSGESYNQFSESLVGSDNLADSLMKASNDGFTITITNSRLLYREVFINETSHLVINDLEGVCSIDKNSIEYGFTGTVEPKFPERKRGSFLLNGTLQEKNRAVSGTVSFKGQRIDLAYLNPYLQDRFNIQDTCTGYTDAVVSAVYAGSTKSIAAEIRINDAELRDKTSETKYPVTFRNSSIIKFSGDSIDDKKIRIRSFEYYDSALSCTASGVYDSVSGTCAGRYSIDEADLTSAGRNYFIGAPFELSGSVSSKGCFQFDLINGISDMLYITARLDKCSVKGRDAYAWIDKIRASGSLTAVRNYIKVDTKGEIGTAPFTLAADIFLRGLLPLSTDTNIQMSSDGISGKLVGKFLIGAARNALEQGAQDKRSGYEEVKFLQLDAGRLVNANDLSLGLDFKSIVIGSKSMLTSVAATYSLKKGVLKGKLDGAQGYGAKYAHEAEGYFNSDYPRFTFSASVSDFNIALWSKDSEGAGITAGTMSASMSYQMNGNRLVHLIDNGTWDAKFTVEKCDIEKAKFLQRLSGYVQEKGFAELPDTLTGSALYLEYKQTGENGFFTRSAFQSDMLRTDSYLRFNSNDGLKGQGTITVTKKDSAAASIPFVLSGSIMSPSFSIAVKGKPASDIRLY
jgi:hypothetical protein